MRGRVTIASFTGVLLLTVTPTAGADIYQWVDDQGVTHFSQVPPASQADVRTVEIEATNPEDWDPQEYDHSIMNQARRTDERLAAAEEERKEEQAGAPPVPYPPPYYYYPPPQPVYYRATVAHRKPYYDYGHKAGPWKRKRHKPPRRPAHRFDHGDRFAHPARSHRRLGADRRFGHLAHRVTHRRPRSSYYDR